MFTQYILDSCFNNSEINGMPRGGSMGRQGGGRVLLHQLNTDGALIIGSDLYVDAAYITAVRKTEKNGIANSKRIEHCRRKKHCYKFLIEHYPEYASVGLWVLKEEYFWTKKFWDNNTHGLVYLGLNTDFSRLSYRPNP